MENLNPEKSFKKKKTPIIAFEKGKIPPQAIELEEAVLGAMLVD